MSKKKAKAQVNEFDETLAASRSFYEKNKKTILYGVGSVLFIVIAALLIHQFYITPRNNRANESIFRAEQAFLDGNYEKALNGEGESMGFLAVIDEYGSTKAGNIACLYAAKCYAATEKYQEAIDMLEKFDGCGDALISPAAIALKGNCYAELGQNEKAAELLVEAAKEADNNTVSPTCLLQAGQLYVALGQKEKALDCYNQIKTKYQQNSVFYEIDKYIEQAQ
ncbi:MAG: tetratricopeptide repeat protein [Bacteroidaceae bacterium]|nr:tetratricopeptide repeat protein [Bacteroidaceae bacterium]